MDHNKLAVELFNRRADVYEEKYMDVGLYAGTLDLFCSGVKAKGRILELACGPGNITMYVLNKRPDLDILATDLAPNMLEIGRKYNPGVEFRLMDCRDVAALQEQFDGVICGFALPYLSKDEAIRLIADISGVLIQGGLFYLSTIEGDYSGSRMQTSSQGDQLLMYYHEAGYLTEALRQNGFGSITIARKQMNADSDTDLIVMAKKNAD